MCFEGFNASFPPSFEPLTDSPLTDSQRSSNVFLLPAFLFQLPRLFASFFSPISFLWCSHTSYLSTLYLSLPRSVSYGQQLDDTQFQSIRLRSSDQAVRVSSEALKAPGQL